MTIISWSYGANINTALYDMKKTHLTYLNSEWNLNFYKYWENQTIQNQSGLEYIRNHLGYRFVLKNVYFVNSPFLSNFIHLNLEIENTGFSNIIHNNKVQIILTNGNQMFIIDTLEDPRYWDSQSISNINLKINLPEKLKDGIVTVYMKLPDRSENDNLSIRFANEEIFNEELHANYLGNFNYTKIIPDLNFGDSDKQIPDQNAEDENMPDNTIIDENNSDNAIWNDTMQNDKENSDTYDHSKLFILVILFALSILPLKNKYLI